MKYRFHPGGRVALSNSARCIETTSYMEAKNILKCIGLDTAGEHRLLDHQTVL
jgi:hypothetical protein